jgi:hypothetical protein
MTTPAAQPSTRRCQGYGYQFRAEPGQAYCSAICERTAGMAAVYAGLRRFAQSGSKPNPHPAQPS